MSTKSETRCACCYCPLDDDGTGFVWKQANAPGYQYSLCDDCVDLKDQAWVNRHVNVTIERSLGTHAEYEEEIPSCASCRKGLDEMTTRHKFDAVSYREFFREIYPKMPPHLEPGLDAPVVLCDGCMTEANRDPAAMRAKLLRWGAEVMARVEQGKHPQRH